MVGWLDLGTLVSAKISAKDRIGKKSKKILTKKFKNILYNYIIK